MAPCASVTVAGCEAARALAVFFAYRALMGWPEGVEPFNYPEIDLMGEAPDVKGWVKRRGDCATCGGLQTAFDYFLVKEQQSKESGDKPAG